MEEALETQVKLIGDSACEDRWTRLNLPGYCRKGESRSCEEERRWGQGMNQSDPSLKKL
jgi:hypothetical protein